MTDSEIRGILMDAITKHNVNITNIPFEIIKPLVRYIYNRAYNDKHQASKENDFQKFQDFFRQMGIETQEWDDVHQNQVSGMSEMGEGCELIPDPNYPHEKNTFISKPEDVQANIDAANKAEKSLDAAAARFFFDKDKNFVGFEVHDSDYEYFIRRK